MNAATATKDTVCKDCPAGTTDHDSDPVTKCAPCKAGVGYTDKPGNVGSCKAATKCKAGQVANGSYHLPRHPLGVGSVVYCYMYMGYEWKGAS